MVEYVSMAELDNGNRLYHSPEESPNYENALKAAKIIARMYEENRVHESVNDFLSFPPISINISDKGAVNIFTEGGVFQTAGTGIVMGELMGAGKSRNKNVKPVFGRGMVFDSFSDFAEVVNMFAKSKDEKIDVADLPRQR